VNVDAPEVTNAVVEALNRYEVARVVLQRSEADLHEPHRPRFRAAYARAARLLGAAGAARISPEGALVELGRPHWTLLDWTRAALLCRALANQVPAGRPALVLTLFEGGEIGEQESLLRTLALLPGGGEFLETALLACRTNALRIFEAIACENAYPQTFFPEPAFNQMVLKTVFLEISVSRIEGLTHRSTPELARMARAYASERSAAGRPVPEDIDIITRAAAADGGTGRGAPTR
jgi:hypothetical protein